MIVWARDYYPIPRGLPPRGFRRADLSQRAAALPSSAASASANQALTGGRIN